MVARLAGVSESTVSCVLNNTRKVSKKTSEKVMAAIKELNYIPDMVARGMSMKKSFQVAVILNDIANILYGEIVSEIEKIAMKNGFFLNICGGYSTFSAYVDHIIARKIDAVYICVNTNKIDFQDIKKLIDAGVTVVMGGYIEEFKDQVSFINVDMKGGLRQELEYLKEKGHKKIGFMSCFPENYKYDDRVDDFKKLMLEIFGERDPKVYSEETVIDTSIENGYRMLKDKVDTNEITALICINDLMAIGAINALEEQGKCVPDDFAVMGIDDNKLSEYVKPSLTSFGPDKKEFGEAVFELMKNGIETGLPKNVMVPVHLHIRNSAK